ncbi:hypothetical protein DNTS_020604 [Danionella cerebrum]|uniref:small monomeric GTPase n=1 Tax=Danionella cerebrum TaxID=2873325 RepID=A0A553R564_9TELE|nr:hypothetical protein DNTS_020604 [Danionella translucida]
MASVSESDLQPSQKDAADQNFDYMFKLLIIGNSGVGKTSLLFRYAEDSFSPAFVSTVGIDFKVKTILRNNNRIKLQIWDTAGQERYRTITTAYYRGATGFLLMFDITNRDSFNAVQDWRVMHTASSSFGSGFQFFEASAKDCVNVKQVFDSLVDVIWEKLKDGMDGGVSVSKPDEPGPHETLGTDDEDAAGASRLSHENEDPAAFTGSVTAPFTPFHFPHNSNESRDKERLPAFPLPVPHRHRYSASTLDLSLTMTL